MDEHEGDPPNREPDEELRKMNAEFAAHHRIILRRAETLSASFRGIEPPEDLVQDAYLTVRERVAARGCPENIVAYLATVMRNKLILSRRKRGPEILMNPLTTLSSEERNAIVSEADVEPDSPDQRISSIADQWRQACDELLEDHVGTRAKKLVCTHAFFLLHLRLFVLNRSAAAKSDGSGALRADRVVPWRPEEMVLKLRAPMDVTIEAIWRHFDALRHDAPLPAGVIQGTITAVHREEDKRFSLTRNLYYQWTHKAKSDGIRVLGPERFSRLFGAVFPTDPDKAKGPANRTRRKDGGPAQ